MNVFEEKVLNFVNEESLISPDSTLIVAVSGGSDSVSLLYSIYKLKTALKIKKIVIAHLNHLLRGEESDRDEDFVRSLAVGLKLDIKVSRIDIKKIALLDVNKKESVESVAHKYRKMFLYDTAKEYNADKILTAHNKNDLAETMLMWLSRGTGLQGLKGILPKSGKIVRPLLAISKEEILTYLRSYGIGFVQDSSNQDKNYTRNTFRHNVLPAIKAIHPNFINSMYSFSKIARLDDDYLLRETDKIYQNEVKELKDGIFFVALDIFQTYHKALLNRLLRKIFKRILGKDRIDIGLSHIESIYNLLDTTGEKEIHLASGIKIKKDNTCLVFGKSVKAFKIETVGEDLKAFKLKIAETQVIEDFKLKISSKIISNDAKVLSSLKQSQNTMYLNYDKLMFPLYIRKASQGDKFHPLGSPGTKKLSDYFTDKKLAPSYRWNKIVLEDRKGILCILGDTVDEGYKVDTHSRMLLRIDIENI